MVTPSTLNASKNRGFTHFKIALSSIVFKNNVLCDSFKALLFVSLNIEYIFQNSSLAAQVCFLIYS